MAKKKPRVNLSQPAQSRPGDLDKLFTSGDDIEQSSGLQLLAIRLDAIQPDPAQPRTTFPEVPLEELAESIRQDGVIQPIEVTESAPGQYMIVHGERRWRAAQLAELEVMPAVVRRRDYDDVTRFVRQVVENIQREDLNDVDRAGALLRLRELMQEELDTARAGGQTSSEPWGGTVTWAKVGGRLGYSRQRIHQLIRLLDLPEEIKEAVRDGALSERDTRAYQGLSPVQQRALYRAQVAGDVDNKQVKQVSKLLKNVPDQTVTGAIRAVHLSERDVDSAAEGDSSTQPASDDIFSAASSVIPARSGAPSAVERLDLVRGHLARLGRQNLNAAERQEVIRLLKLIEQDVDSLLATLENF